MLNPAMPEIVARRLGYAIKRAQHALRLAMDQALRPAGLTMAQYAVLCALEAEPGLSNARLARAAFVTPQTMQGVLANLEREGLVERRAAPGNARILRGEITARGMDSLGRAHEAVAVVERIMGASLDGDAADRLADALYACADDLAAALDGAPPARADARPRP